MIKTKLRKARLNKGISQEALVYLIGMAQCNYNPRENGKKSISHAEWKKITRALEVKKEVIFEANILNNKTQNVSINIPYYNIPGFFIDQYELLENENTVLKKKIEIFENNLLNP